MLQIISMFGSVTGGTQDALATIDVPADGILRGVDWDAFFNVDADTESMAAELSFIATDQLIQNDIRGRISSISGQVTVLTAVGGHIGSIQKWVNGFELTVAGGERLYLNVLSTVGVTGQIRANLHLDIGGVVTRRSARR